MESKKKIILVEISSSKEILLNVENLIIQLVFIAYNMVGMSLDCGNNQGFLKTFTEYGIMHKGMGEGFTQFLKNIVKGL